MNKYSLVGTVSYFEVKEFPRDNGSVIKKISWMLGSKKGQAFNNLPCETWNTSFENLTDNMTIELTDYIPVNHRYTDTKTGQTKSRFFLEVKEARVVYEDEIGGKGLVMNVSAQPQPQTQTQPFINKSPIETFKENLNTFNVEKEAKKLMEEEVYEEEDVIDLEWEEDTKKEWEQQQQDTIKQMEEALDDVPRTVEEIINESITTSPHEEEDIDKKIEKLSKRVVTQEEINTLNNIPKLEGEIPYEGEIGIEGAKFITKENEEEDW